MNQSCVPYMTNTLGRGGGADPAIVEAEAENGRRKKVIYVAGPYRDPRGEWHVRENIRSAEKVAMEIWQRGGVALCPHKNTAFFGGLPGTDDDTWLQGDLELLRRCDALMVAPKWRASSGALAEVTFARQHKILVLYNYQELWDFLGFEG